MLHIKPSSKELSHNLPWFAICNKSNSIYFSTYCVNLIQDFINSKSDPVNEAVTLSLSHKPSFLFLPCLNLSKLYQTKLISTTLNSFKINSIKLKRNCAKLSSTKINSTKTNFTKLNVTKLNYTKLISTKLNSNKFNATKLNLREGGVCYPEFCNRFCKQSEQLE